MKQLVIIEGPDCSGKSTLGKAIARYYNGVYFHCTYTEPLGHAMRDYQTSVLNNALNGIKHGQIWVIDRLWPSEVVYSKIFRPHMHPEALRTADMLHGLVTSVDSIYVYCNDSEVMKRHAMEIDPDHPYNQEKFREICIAYDDWAGCMHEDYIAHYNLQVHGHIIPKWIQTTLA